MALCSALCIILNCAVGVARWYRLIAGLTRHDGNRDRSLVGTGVSMSILIIQILEFAFLRVRPFPHRCGPSLIYGVMRIVNLAHGTFYALGAYVSAWAVGGAFGAAGRRHSGLPDNCCCCRSAPLAVAVVGAVIEPLLLRRSTGGRRNISC